MYSQRKDTKIWGICKGLQAFYCTIVAIVKPRFGSMLYPLINYRYMKSYSNDYSEQLVGSWWLSIIVGLVALCASFIVLINPMGSYLSVAMLFGVAMLVSGIITLVQCFTTDNGLLRNGWVIVGAIADIIIGVLLSFNILLTAAMLPILFGIWLLSRGFVGVIQGMDLRALRLPNAGWIVLGSVVMMCVGLVVLLLPDIVGVELIIVCITLAFMSYGFSAISLGLRLYAVHRRAQDLQ